MQVERHSGRFSHFRKQIHRHKFQLAPRPSSEFGAPGAKRDSVGYLRVFVIYLLSQKGQTNACREAFGQIFFDFSFLKKKSPMKISVGTPAQSTILSSGCQNGLSWLLTSVCSLFIMLGGSNERNQRGIQLDFL